MSNLRVGDRVRIKPVVSVQNTDYHNREGIVSRVLDIRTAMWPIGVELSGGIGYFDESELEKIGMNVFARPEPVTPPRNEDDSTESLTDNVVSEAAALMLLRDAADNRLDLAIDYLKGRVNVYHQMFHIMEDSDDSQAMMIYALVHDEAMVALRLLEQYKEEDGVIDAE